MGPASRNSEHLAIIRDLVHAKAYCVSADLSNNLREAKPVPESSDWKQKYRDSLLEMETEEKRWRQVEQLLRRLIGRLCAAGMGIDPQLDDELSALAAANRRNADASELEQLADSLTTVVVAVDEVSSVRHPVAPLPITRASPGGRDVNSKLDREKHGARLDPLTGAANRKSFDERFAKDIDRRSLSEAPVTMQPYIGPNTAAKICASPPRRPVAIFRLVNKYLTYFLRFPRGFLARCAARITRPKPRLNVVGNLRTTVMK